MSLDSPTPDSPGPPGILVDRELRARFGSAVRAATPLSAQQVQPASLDLRLGSELHRVRASFLPAGGDLESRLAELSEELRDTQNDLRLARKALEGE